MSIKLNSARRIIAKFLTVIFPYRPNPGGKELLDKEYKEGLWGYLANQEELPRFSIVVGYCHFFKTFPSILEIGCGEGHLAHRLCPTKFKEYVGVDISEEAIKTAKKNAENNCSFFCEDAWDFIPKQKFDIIIFNECLIYIDKPKDLFNYYASYLENDGIFISSVFEENRSHKIWKEIESSCQILTETIVNINILKGLETKIKVLAPIQSFKEK